MHTHLERINIYIWVGISVLDHNFVRMLIAKKTNIVISSANLHIQRSQSLSLIGLWEITCGLCMGERRYLCHSSSSLFL